MHVDSSWRFHLKHDGVNLYFAFDGAGGNLRLNIVFLDRLGAGDVIESEAGNARSLAGRKPGRW